MRKIDSRVGKFTQQNLTEVGRNWETYNHKGKFLHYFLRNWWNKTRSESTVSQAGTAELHSNNRAQRVQGKPASHN